MELRHDEGLDGLLNGGNGGDGELPFSRGESCRRAGPLLLVTVAGASAGLADAVDLVKPVTARAVLNPGANAHNTPAYTRAPNGASSHRTLRRRRGGRCSEFERCSATGDASCSAVSCDRIGASNARWNNALRMLAPSGRSKYSIALENS
jgi:hypothetical protein